MKKLMTMIAAVATAFGLYAADTLNNSVDFSSYTAVNPWTLTGSDGQSKDTLWTWTGTAADPATDEAQIEGGALVLSTGTNVLSRKFAAGATDINDGLFVDMVLDYNGEALDTVPTVEDGKIAIFALDQTEIEDIPDNLKAQTNIYVLANYGTNGKALYNLGVFDFTSPRRVALKAYSNVITGDADARAGFLVYMGPANAQIQTLQPAAAIAVYAFDGDGKVVWTDVRSNEPNYLGRSDVVSSKWVNGKQLFISLDTKPSSAAKLESVDFAGRAKLASITLADYSTDWPADDVRMAVTLTDATITDIANATLDGNYLVADNNGVTVTFKVTPDKKDNVTVAYTGTISGPGQDGVYTIIFNENNTLTVKGWDTAATVSTEKFESLFGDAGAIAYVNANGGTLKLAKAVTVGDAQAEVLKFAGSDVVLDLNGQTITISGAEKMLENSGKLTIMDSATGGNIVGTTANYNELIISNGVFNGAVDNTYGVDKMGAQISAGVTTIYGGTFNGVVENMPKGAEVESDVKIIAVGGKFLQDVNTEVAVKAFVDLETYEVIAGAEELAGYWVVQKQTQKSDIKDADVTASATYGDAAPAVTVTLNKVAIDSTNYDISFSPQYSAKTAAGTVITVTVTAKGATYTGTASGVFTVVKKELTGVSVSLKVTEATFDAEKTTPGAYATPTIDGLDGVDAGEYTAAWDKTEVTAQGGTFIYSVEAKANGNYNFATASATLTVKAAAPIPPLPANPTADDVNTAVDAAKFADEAVKTMIGGDQAKYNAFKTWADTVTGGEAAVVASAHAADSYLLGQTTLLQNAPASEIKTIAKTSDTALTLTFEIKDGANAVTVADSAKAYVESIIQCNEKVDFGNGTKIAADVTVTINGTTLTAAVALPANKPAAFMKVAK